MDYWGNIINLVGTSTNLYEKIQALKRKCDTLRSQEDDIIHQLQLAESSYTKKRRKEIENWLGNVKRTRYEVQNLPLQVSGTGSLARILGGKHLADGVEDLTKEVEELMEQGQFSQGLTLDVHEEVVMFAPKLVGQASERYLKIIWENLRKAEVLKIGVWGMGGVGKTTLIKHIHNQIQHQTDTFNHVYWITVSQNPSIRRLQGDIANAIHFDISFEDDEGKRAAILSRELMKRKRSVIILDDVWNDICLEKMGITTTMNGCKLLVTTRSLDVCRRLPCDEIVKITPLSGKDAWELFEKTLTNSKVALSPQVSEVAKFVAQECAGLPLAIVTLASSMREVNDILEWRTVLQDLVTSKEGLMEEEVFQVLKLIYSRLNDPKVQQCFLYCVLYPENHYIAREELIQYLIDEGLVEKMRDRQSQFDRGHSILNKLVNACLLEVVKFDVDFDIVEGVKLHGVVRDMGIKMMRHEFMVKAGMGLDVIADKEEWSKDLKRVSLMENKIEEMALRRSPRCPKLLTLFLSGNRTLKRIENSFFECMSALQVLNLSECGQMEELPNSISNLKSLSALVLRHCGKLQYMPSLAELTSLKRLDLENSGIRGVPRGLEMLVNLTYLDLSDTINLLVFPSGILPKLSQLEYLKFHLWGVKIKGEELRKLERLSTFQGCLTFDDNVNGFKEYVMSRSEYVWFNCNYVFILDDGEKVLEKSYNHIDNLNWVRIEKWSVSNRAEEEDASVDAKTLEALLKGVQSLEIVKSKDARSLCDVFWLDSAALDLKKCCINRCEGMECVGSFSNPLSSSPRLFQTLEELRLEDLQNLRILFELDEENEGEFGGRVPNMLPRLPALVFSFLKELNLWECPKIKKLLQPWFLPNLQNLEVIVVACCGGLEEIIAAAAFDEATTGSSSHSSTVEYTLPNLRTISLSELPKLKSICAETISCASLSEIKVVDCPKLKRIPLSQHPSSLCSIKVGGLTPEEWWESVEWDRPNAKSVLLPYLQFRGVGEKFDEMPHHSISFSKGKASVQED